MINITMNLSYSCFGDGFEILRRKKFYLIFGTEVLCELFVFIFVSVVEVCLEMSCFRVIFIDYKWSTF